MICVHELKIKLLKSKFESCPVSSCSRSWYLGIVTSSFPVSQASCELVFPLVVVTPKSLEFFFTLNSPICVWKGKTYRHNMTIGSRQNLANAKFMNLELDNRPIEHKPSTKLLGVHIDEMLNWDNQIKHISSKVS